MKYLITFFLCFQVILINAQVERLFWESSASLDYGISKRISFNTSLGQRSVFTTEDESGERYEQLFYEIDQFATAKINSSIKLSAGYKYRFESPFDATASYEHRLTQQMSVRHIKSALRLVSRVRAEQRFTNEGEFIHRYRYRLSADFPLSGASLDVREFYVVISSETLLAVDQNTSNSLDNRLAASLGYLVNSLIKIQLTATQRLERYNLETNQRTFLATNIYFNLR